MPLKVGSSQQYAGLNSEGMIVDDQLHSMPMRFSQGLQQAINRGAEVMHRLDHDHITARAGQWHQGSGVAMVTPPPQPTFFIGRG